MQLKKAVVLAFMIASTRLVFSQTPDVAVATVRLVRTEVISQRDFRDKVSRLERLAQKPMEPADKIKLIDVLVSEVLLAQAAERAGIRATDAEIIAFAKSTARVPATVPDAEFRRMIEQQSGSTWAAFLTEARKSYVTQKFIMSKPEASHLQNVEITDARVNEFYNENKAQFMNPDLVRISHIFFDTKQQPRGTIAEIRARATAALGRLNSNQATFEELVRTDSEDEGSKPRNGDLGFLARGDAQAIGLFGRDFVALLFGMRKGATSTTLMESNAGLHIVRITDKLDQRFLAITDKISPLDTRTVREYIRLQLTAQEQQKKLQEFMQSVVDGLKAETQADIKTFPQNF